MLSPFLLCIRARVVCVSCSCVLTYVHVHVCVCVRARASVSVYSHVCRCCSVCVCVCGGHLCVFPPQTGRAGVPRSPSLAVAPLVKSCESGESIACHNLGVLFQGGSGVAADAEKSKYFLSRAKDHLEAQMGTKLPRESLK